MRHLRTAVTLGYVHAAVGKCDDCMPKPTQSHFCTASSEAPISEVKKNGLLAQLCWVWSLPTAVLAKVTCFFPIPPGA